MYVNSNDLWALGCTLYQMLSGTSPFKDASEWLIFQRIIARDIRFPNYFSDEARDLIDRLLVSYKVIASRFSFSSNMLYFFFLSCILNSPFPFSYHIGFENYIPLPTLFLRNKWLGLNLPSLNIIYAYFCTDLSLEVILNTCVRANTDLDNDSLVTLYLVHCNIVYICSLITMHYFVILILYLLNFFSCCTISIRWHSSSHYGKLYIDLWLQFRITIIWCFDSLNGDIIIILYQF